MSLCGKQSRPKFPARHCFIACLPWPGSTVSRMLCNSKNNGLFVRVQSVHSSVFSRKYLFSQNRKLVDLFLQSDTQVHLFCNHISVCNDSNTEY